MPAESNSYQPHEFYFVAYPFLELAESKDTEREFAEYRKKRSQIIDTIRAKRVERKVVEKIKPLFDEEKAYKERCNEITKRLSELNFNFKNVKVPKDAGDNHNIPSSEEEIDRAVAKLEVQFKGGRNTRVEKNHLLKQIKDLEKSRGQVLSVEDWNLKRKLKDIWNEKKAFRDIHSEIRSLEKDLQQYSSSMKHLSPSLDQLRTRRNQNNELPLQLRAVRDDAI